MSDAVPLSCLLVALLSISACGGSSDNAVPENVSESPEVTLELEGEPSLRLTASGTDGDFSGEPSCMTSLNVHNLSDKPLAVFSAPFEPVHAETGARLETVGGLDAGVRGLPLAPGATTADAWQINVKGASCAQVNYRLGEALCALEGASCGLIGTEHVGLADFAPVRTR